MLQSRSVPFTTEGFSLQRIAGEPRNHLAAGAGVGLLVQARGSGRFDCPEAGPIPLDARDALIHDAGLAASCAMSGPEALAFEVRFRPAYLAHVARLELGVMSPPIAAGSSRLLQDPALSQLVLSLSHMEGGEDAATLTVLARALAARLLGRHMLAGRDRRADARLQAVLAHIDANLEAPLRIEVLARIAGVTVFHFSRLFTRKVGISAMAYIRARRVERAKVLIRQDKAPLAEIAYACGFAHQSHFTAVFRTITGQTPGAFRSEVRARREGSVRPAEPWAAPSDP